MDKQRRIRKLGLWASLCLALVMLPVVAVTQAGGPNTSDADETILIMSIDTIEASKDGPNVPSYENTKWFEIRGFNMPLDFGAASPVSDLEVFKEPGIETPQVLTKMLGSGSPFVHIQIEWLRIAGTKVYRLESLEVEGVSVAKIERVAGEEGLQEAWVIPLDDDDVKSVVLTLYQYDKFGAELPPYVAFIKE
jgi:hypothetical protein